MMKHLEMMRHLEVMRHLPRAGKCLNLCSLRLTLAKRLRTSNLIGKRFYKKLILEVSSA